MAAAPPVQMMDGVGTAPPWMRNAPGMGALSAGNSPLGTSPMDSSGGGMMDAGMGGAMSPLRTQLAGIMAGSGGPGNAMGGMDNPVSSGGGPGGSVMDSMGGMGGPANPVGMGGAMGGSMSGAGGPSGPGSGMTGVADAGAPTGGPTNPVSGVSDLHQALSQAYDAASGSGSSAPQPADTAPTTSGMHPAMSKSMTAAPTQASLTSASTPTTAASPAPAAATPPHVDTGVGVDNPYAGVPNAGNAPEGYKYGPDGFLQSDPDYWHNLQTTQAAQAAPAAAPGAGAGAASAPGAPSAQTPSGIITGSQASYKGGPNVTTADVNYAGMPNVSQDFSADAQRGADAAYKGATTYFDTDFKRQNQDLASQLAAQGFAPGSEGFNRQMELAQRSQDTARTQAAQQAQQIGFQQSGDLMQRALAARQQAVGEQQNDADRKFNQSFGIAGLGLQGRGQDMGLQTAQANAAGAAQAAGASRDASNYRADIDAQIQLRNLGLQGDNQDFNHAMQLATLSQGTVPGLNFGAATPLDVGGAYGIASGNNNANLARGASNTNALYNLGGSLLGSYFRGP
jgi:hypothetical protein